MEKENKNENDGKEQVRDRKSVSSINDLYKESVRKKYGLNSPR